MIMHNPMASETVGTQAAAGVASSSIGGIQVTETTGEPTQSSVAVHGIPIDFNMKVNLGTTINQAFSQEVPMLPRTILTAIRGRFIAVEGDEPMEQAEVSDAQLSALKAVLDQGMPPYVDFGVFGPHGNRQARRQKFTYMQLDTSGRWHNAEQAGPPNLDAWRNSWAVFTAAAIMLDVATPATLSRYARRFEERCHRYPRSWYLAVTAEDRCRSEFWASERRRQERFQCEHPGLSAFMPKMPWESVIKESTNNVEYWMRELQEPALAARDRTDSNPSWVRPQLEDRGEKRPWDRTQKDGAKGDGGDKTGVNPCRNFNVGKCTQGSICRYAHVCAECGGDHPKIECTEPAKNKGGKPKGKGKGKKFRKGSKGR